MCNSKLNYHKYKDTHIWLCPACMNIQFEFISLINVKELNEFLEKRNNK